LIGYGPDCLVRPAAPKKGEPKKAGGPPKSGHASAHYGKRIEKNGAKKDAHDSKKERALHPRTKQSSKNAQKHKAKK
ncbi:MAG: hypothetical protein IJX80_10270, partial [Clostridia bacterium]|nr:hypothetical protein [Clostridia bacterium]